MATIHISDELYKELTNRCDDDYDKISADGEYYNTVHPSEDILAESILSWGIDKFFEHKYLYCNSDGDWYYE